MHKQRLILIFLLLSLLSACGGSNSPSTSLQVSLTDFSFTPSRFTVPAGQEIKLDVSNDGHVIHNFIIMNAGTSVGTEYTSEDDANVYWGVEVPSQGSTSTSFMAPAEPGEYEVVCSTPGHVQAGMLGTLVVVAEE